MKSTLQFEGISSGGDNSYSSGFGVIAEPYTTVTALTAADSYLVLASDGMFAEEVSRAHISGPLCCRWQQLRCGTGNLPRPQAGCLSRLPWRRGCSVWARPGMGWWAGHALGWLMNARAGLRLQVRGGGGGLDNETVAELCNSAGNASCEALAQTLALTAQEVGSTDDVTVVVMRLGA